MTQDDATLVARPEQPFDWSSHGLSHPGNVRAYNEDAYLCQPGKGLWAVADGMGGHHAGDVASRAVVESLGAVALCHGLPELIKRCCASLQAANAQLQASDSDGQNRLCGSTAVVLLTHGRRGAVVWAGDSRVYRLSRNAERSELTQLTRDHSKVAELVRQGQLTEAEAERHPDANMITRAIGVRPSLELDVQEFDIDEGDTYLLCSDGLTRYVTAPEMARLLAGASISQAADALVAATLATAARDNVTVVVARASGDSITRTLLNPASSYQQPVHDDPTVLDETSAKRRD
ncbi:MAG: PP2C family protein-serine/threonine phosphatase [Pseudomonadales bacterium]